jgi:phage-related protein
MAEFTWAVTKGTQLSMQPRVLEARFGDGYSQRTADGINTNPQIWSIVIDNREKAEGDAIQTFLEARAGHESFDWTPPDMAMAKFICKQWSRAYPIMEEVSSFNLIFEQIFE